MNIWKSNKVYTAFLSMGHTFWKENINFRQSKIFEIKRLELLCKDNNGRFA